MRVFITGVAGFLGSHLAEAFVERGDDVSGCDNLIGGDIENVPSGIDFFVDDCGDFEHMARALRGVEVVYHCAATAHEGLSVFSPAENWKHGPTASASVFSAACAQGVRRIVFTSSMARYGNGDGPPPFHEEMTPMPEDPYGIGKFASEMLLANLAETHGVEFVIAVPHNIYGPKQKYNDPFRNVVTIFANRMLRGKQPIIYGDGSQERCFSYYTDCVEPLVKMASQANVVGKIINIGPDDHVISVYDVAGLVAKCVGHTNLSPIFVPSRPREVQFAHCSARKARALLGYNPKVSLEEGIEKTVDFVRERRPRPFSYHRLKIEINTKKVPITWTEGLL